jgi:hypothetical protein
LNVLAVSGGVFVLDQVVQNRAALRQLVNKA